VKIYIGSDHGGYDLRRKLIAYLAKQGYKVEDEGNAKLDPNDDYPQFAEKVAVKVLSSDDPDAKGILICRGAQGMGMAANRFKGIRASLVWDAHEAKMTRNDNDSNVLCLSARLYDSQDESVVHDVVDTWLKTPFSPAARHHRRVRELDNLTP
jgi:ribose 5-phosphate isomerase B